jgi:hypothetical protein
MLMGGDQLERAPSRPCSNPNLNAETRYRVLHEGGEIGVWRGPECSPARFLVDKGLDSRDDVLRTYRGDIPCMSGSVGWFADRGVDKSDGRGKDGPARFVRWRPNPFALSRRFGQKSPSDDEAGVMEPVGA